MLATTPPGSNLDRYAGTSNLKRSAALADHQSGLPGAATQQGVSVIILNLDRPELIVPLLDLLDQTREPFAEAAEGFEVIVGDTGSTDPAVLDRYARSGPWVKVVSGMDYHFSANNNRCVREHARQDALLFLNNDVAFPSPQPLLDLLAAFRAQDSRGVCGLVLDYPDKTVQHAGIDVVRQGPATGLPWHPHRGESIHREPGRIWPALAVTGACLMTSRACFDAVGGFDEQYEAEAQDVDLCLAMHRHGDPVRILDAGSVLHLENGTRQVGEEHPHDRRLFLRRWRSWLEATVW